MLAFSKMAQAAYTKLWLQAHNETGLVISILYVRAQRLQKVKWDSAYNTSKAKILPFIPTVSNSWIFSPLLESWNFRSAYITSSDIDGYEKKVQQTIKKKKKMKVN